MGVRVILQGIILCFSPMLLVAQVEFKVVPDMRTARVGDIISLRVEAKFPSGTRVKWSIPDSVPHWEWVEKGMPLPISTGSVVSFSFNCRFIGYDTGYWPLPPVKLIAGNQTFLADTSFIQVNYANADLSLPFKDIKPLMELSQTSPKWSRWLIGLGFILLVIFATYLYYNRKRGKSKWTNQQDESLVAFLQQVQLLEEDYQKGDLRERQFYERWVSILRKYIRWKTGKSSSDQGTRQIVESMESAGLHEELREKMGVCLQISEKARFACHRPDDADNKKALQVLKSALGLNHQNT